MEAGIEILEKIKANADVFKELSVAVHQVLHEKPREMQALVLADCIAMWIAAHFGPEEQIEDFRKNMLLMFMKSIITLIPINEQMFRETMSDEDMAEMKAAVEFAEGGKKRH